MVQVLPIYYLDGNAAGDRRHRGESWSRWQHSVHPHDGDGTASRKAKNRISRYKTDVIYATEHVQAGVSHFLKPAVETLCCADGSPAQYFVDFLVISIL